MKIYIKFALVAVTVLLIASCEQEPQPTYPNGDLPIFNGYMQFSTEVSTRTNLATDMKGKAFGVIGFEYSNTAFWSGAKSTTAPNDYFYNQRVDCDANNGVCQYDYTNTTPIILAINLCPGAIIAMLFLHIIHLMVLVLA